MPTCVTPAAPDAVLIFWDSDVSDVNEDILSSADKYTLRQTYRTNLLGTLDTLKSSGESSHHIISHHTTSYHIILSFLHFCIDGRMDEYSNHI